ncbi:hypothetical protein [Streptomyces sp. NPDC016845]|uniref:hypothetical protein n=1 Tax=Streptomyces sp. NPDC016845 TaxID=3364972 RepID=UPI00379C913C
MPNSPRDGGAAWRCAPIARRHPSGGGLRSTWTAGKAGAAGTKAAAVVGPVFTGAGAKTCRAQTFAPGTLSTAAAISFGALQRSFVPTAGASGKTSRRPVSASNAAACTRLAS